MAYNPYNDILEIYKSGQNWQNEQDVNKRNKIHENAKQYYSNLVNGGYSTLADELSASGSDRRAEILNKYKRFGKTSTRDYLYSLGKSRDMSQSEIDNLIKYDDTTGEISFGGKNIGKPDTVVDGKSYWSSTDMLDNAFNDYVSRSGKTRSKPALVDQENESLFKKYNQEYEDLKSTNPFETEEGRAIMAKYGLAGLLGRDNAAAQGAASNGGNIDSFSAANAMRQQAALYAQGQGAVLDAHRQKLEHARNLLSDIGVNIERVFNEDETAKNNATARLSEQASVTGYTPAEWSIQNDAFLKNFVDDSGKLKPEYKDTDFQELINNAKASGNNELANKYAILRGLKIFGNFTEYGKYLNGGDVSYIQPQRAADYDLKKQQIDSAERIAAAGNNANLEAAKIEAQNNLDKISATANANIKLAKAAGGSASSGTSSNYTSGAQKPALTASQAASAIKNGEKSQSVIDAYNYYYGTNYTVDNPPTIETSNSSDWANNSGESNSDSSKTDYTAKLNGVYKESSGTVKDYIRNQLNPLITENTITETELKEHLISHSKQYDLEVSDIKKICEALGVDSMWVDNYKNSGFLGWGAGVKQK